MSNTDKTTKFLLGTITVALWIIAVRPFVEPSIAFAVSHLSYDVGRIRSDLDSIASGICLNSKIC